MGNVSKTDSCASHQANCRYCYIGIVVVDRMFAVLDGFFQWFIHMVQNSEEVSLFVDVNEGRDRKSVV